MKGSRDTWRYLEYLCLLDVFDVTCGFALSVQQELIFFEILGASPNLRVGWPGPKRALSTRGVVSPLSRLSPPPVPGSGEDCE